MRALRKGRTPCNGCSRQFALLKCARMPKRARAADEPPKLRPYTVHAFTPGSDAYVRDMPTTKLASRWWSYRGQIRTMQLHSGEYLKCTSRFDELNDDELRAVIEES